MEALYQKIEAYVNGELKGKDLSDFEMSIQNDPALAHEVNLWQDIDHALADKQAMEFQQMVAQESAEFLKKEKGLTRIFSLKPAQLAIAASLVLAIISTVIYLNISSHNSLSGADLYAAYYESYEIDDKAIRGADTNDPAFEVAIAAYKSGDYKSAIEGFETLDDATTNDMSYGFYLACTFLNQKPPQLDAAERAFQKVIDHGKSIFVPDALWYQALIHLKKEEIDDAKVLLQEIINSNSSRKKEAENLLKQLD